MNSDFRGSKPVPSHRRPPRTQRERLVPVPLFAGDSPFDQKVDLGEFLEEKPTQVAPGVAETRPRPRPRHRTSNKQATKHVTTQAMKHVTTQAMKQVSVRNRLIEFVQPSVSSSLMRRSVTAAVFSVLAIAALAGGPLVKASVGGSAPESASASQAAASDDGSKPVVNFAEVNQGAPSPSDVGSSSASKETPADAKPADPAVRTDVPNEAKIDVATSVKPVVVQQNTSKSVLPVATKPRETVPVTVKPSPVTTPACVENVVRQVPVTTTIQKPPVAVDPAAQATNFWLGLTSGLLSGFGL